MLSECGPETAIVAYTGNMPCRCIAHVISHANDVVDNAVLSMSVGGNWVAGSQVHHNASTVTCLWLFGVTTAAPCWPTAHMMEAILLSIAVTCLHLSADC